ncbi:MAG: S41 family peptidase [Candidatus Goldiibacteriota bacterium]
MKRKITAITAVVLAVSVFFGFLAKKNDAYESLKPLMEVYAIIQDSYVDDEKTDPQDLVEEAINGMVKHLDPFSQYLDKQSYEDMTADTKAEFGGLGIEISIKDGQLTVVAPIEDTPAYRAGIKAGDKIIAIEGESTEGIDIMDAVHKLRGKPDTEVTITVQRGVEPKPRDITITRAIIKIKTARYYILGDDTGYIKINEFMGRADKVVNEAVREFNEKKINKLILDLRNNPGGLLDQSVRVSDFFLSKEKMIVYTQGREKSKRAEFKAEKDKIYKGDVVVLINNGSASASEIVAGALQDNKRAIVLGSRTFGKGSVQTIVPLSDKSALRLTTAQYFTPGGDKIHGVGIKPDIELDEPIPSSFTAGLYDDGHIEKFAVKYLKEHPEGLTAEMKESVKVSESDLKVLFEKDMDEKLLEEFGKFLRRESIDVKAQEFAADREIILRWIKSEIAKKHKGRDAERRASIENDTQVKRAINILNAFTRISEIQ